MSEEWKKEFFEWKDQIESKYNDLSESKIKCENKIEVLEGKLSEWNEIMNISIKGNIDERIMSLEKITDAQVIVNEYHSKGFNRLEEVLRDHIKSHKFKEEKGKEVVTKGILLNTWLAHLNRSLKKLDSLKKEEIIGCSTCKFNLDGSFVCETCDTGFTNYEPIDSEKKEHIALLNDLKAFEVVNLGVLKRERKDSGGAIKFSEDPLGIWVKGKFYPDSDKFPEVEKHPEPICPFCGRNLILYNQKWICGHGCTKPAIKSKESEPEKEFEVIETIQAMINHEHMLVKQHKKEIQKLIEDAIKDLDELIAWSNNYPKDSEIYIRLKRKREKWQGKQK